MQKYLEKERSVVLAHERMALVEELMDEYGDEILWLVYTYVKNQAVAEELTQEIFIKCYNGLPKFKGNCSYKTWLYRIAINHSKDYNASWYAKNIQAYDFGQVELESDECVESQVVTRDENSQLVQAVGELPEKLRIVIYLFYFEDKTSKEIAQLLQINENTVKSRLRKAKQVLEKMLGGV